MPKTQNAYYKILTKKTPIKNVRKRTFAVRVRTSEIMTIKKDFQEMICVLKYFYSTFVE